MTSDRQHDAFDNPAKVACREGNLRVLREAARRFSSETGTMKLESGARIDPRREGEECMHEISGWFMGKVFFLNEEPRKKEDIVYIITGIFSEVAEDDDYVYPTEQEAWVEAKKELAAQKQQALRDLAFLSKPYIVNGTLCIDDPQNLAKRKVEAQKSLRIAEQGLRLCPG